jgi:hypothetical protein
MTFKQFLKPDWRKIVIFVILSIALFLVPWNIAFSVTEFRFIYSESGMQGIPLPAYICIEALTAFGTPPPPCGVFYPFLIIDLIIWYLLSGLIVWVYDKVRKKRIR